MAIAPQRTLWLFSDTWVGSVRKGKRENATIVNNTLALQDGQGKDAKVQFIVRKDDAGEPGAFITPADKRGWYWLQAGAVSGDRLLLFLSQIEKGGSTGRISDSARLAAGSELSTTRDPPLTWRHHAAETAL